MPAAIDWVVVFTFFVCGAAFVFAVSQRAQVVAPAVATFVIHAVIGVVVFAGVGLFSPDAVHYDNIAVELAFDTEVDGVNRPITPGKEGFPTVVAVLYRFVGHSPEAGLILNAIICAMLVVVCAKLAGRLGGLPTLTAWMTALFPPFLLWGSLLLREAAAWLLVALFVYCSVGALERIGSRAWAWSGMAASLGALFWVRGTLAIVVGVAVAAVFVLRSGLRRLLWTVTAVGVGLVVLSPLIIPRIQSVLGGYSLARVNEIRASLAATADVSGFAVTPITGPLSAVQSVAEVLPRVVVGPLPWEWPTVGPLFVVDGLAWSAILVLAVVGVVRSQSPTRWVVPAAVVLGLLAILTATSGNYGTMQRLRTQAVPLLLPAASIAVAWLWRWFLGAPSPRRSQTDSDRHGRR